MESRVLSGTTAISGLGRLRKQISREITNNTCVVPTTRSIGAVGDGGNLIWGRQLRPVLLLLEKSPAARIPAVKREILRPSFAAASSPAEGSHSAGEAKVGFLEKYPALVTGSFFFMWYFLNVIFNILNKKIYNYFPYPYFVSVVHLLVGVIYCLVSWAVGLPKRAVSFPLLLSFVVVVGFRLGLSMRASVNGEADQVIESGFGYPEAIRCLT